MWYSRIIIFLYFIISMPLFGYITTMKRGTKKQQSQKTIAIKGLEQKNTTEKSVAQRAHAITNKQALEKLTF